MMLEKELVDVKIEQHRKGYIHIPFSWGGLYRSLAVLGSLALSLLCLYGVFYFWDYFKVYLLFNPVDEVNVALVSTSQLFFLYPYVFWFFSVWLVAFVVKVWFNKGLDGCDFSGLVGGLFFALVVGLVVGLFFALVVGLIVGLVVGLIVGLVGGLFFALVVGLIVGLVGGLVESYS